MLPRVIPSDLKDATDSNFDGEGMDHEKQCQIIAVPQENGTIQLVEVNAEQPVRESANGAPIVAVEVPPAPRESGVVYVNAKQYKRILKRREARAKLASEGLLPPNRQRYLHESRHRIAKMRKRNEGGRFLSGRVVNQNGAASEEPEKSYSPIVRST